VGNLGYDITRNFEIRTGTYKRKYPKVSGLSYNEIHSLRSNTKGYGGKTH